MEQKVTARVVIIRTDGKIIDGTREKTYLRWTAWDPSREWNGIFVGEHNVSAVSATKLTRAQYNSTASQNSRSALYGEVVLFRHKNSQIYDYDVDTYMSDIMGRDLVIHEMDTAGSQNIESDSAEEWLDDIMYDSN